MRLALFTCILLATASLATGDTSAFKIVDDDALSSAVTSVRAEFLQGKHFDRLDCTILVLQPDGTWRRGSHNPETIAYPASCVKLAYMASAMNWCRENRHHYEHLDAIVRPMVTLSDNVKTGDVVDAITGAPNIADLTTTTPEYMQWMEKRLYTERFLAARGLLGNQVIANKTYPTNSGEMPSGAEKMMIAAHGRNMMQPKLAASLMLEIQKGAIEPGARAYMRSLLEHDRWGGSGIIGSGLPPGSVYENKPGVAYDTVEDIAYCVLPNKREFIMAVFTNSYEDDQPSPHDSNILSGFCEMLIDRIGLIEGCPPKVVVDNDGPQFSTEGDWKQETTGSQKFGATFASAVATTGGAVPRAKWSFEVAAPGMYEICAWFPRDTGNTSEVLVRVEEPSGYGPKVTTATLRQDVAGGRWVKLGDFQIIARRVDVIFEPTPGGAGGRIVADSIKATAWPRGRTIALKIVEAEAMDTGSRLHAMIRAQVNRLGDGRPVEGARVKVDFSGDATGTQTVFSDKDGVVRFKSPGFPRGGRVSAKFGDLWHSGYGLSAGDDSISTLTIPNPWGPYLPGLGVVF